MIKIKWYNVYDEKNKQTEEFNMDKWFIGWYSIWSIQKMWNDLYEYIRLNIYVPWSVIEIRVSQEELDKFLSNYKENDQSIETVSWELFPSDWINITECDWGLTSDNQEVWHPREVTE